jgi:thiopeptide-type bacteriocin biosynthesis protein
MTRRLVPSGGFVLRTPLLSASIVDRLGDGLSAAAWTGGDPARPGLDEAIAADRAVVTERLRELVGDPAISEAIFVASPALSEQVGRWLDGDSSAKSDEPAIVRSLLSYVSRMSTRCTPFGLFAGCSAGEVREALDLRLPDGDPLRRTTRLDYGFLAGLVTRIEADPEARGGLTFRPNSSLYRAGGRLRMAERRVVDGVIRYHRVTFEEDEALSQALAAAATGIRLDDLVTAFVDDDVSAEEAREYLDALVDSQVLVSDLGPIITGGDPVEALIAQLADHPATKRVSEELAAAKTAIDVIDSRGAGNEPAAYRAVADDLRSVEPALNVSRLFQVDLARPAPDLALSTPIVDEMVRAVEALWRIYPPSEPTELDQFRAAFRERYEDREVPLVLALDEELGVGFGAPAGPSVDGTPLLANLPPALEPDQSGSWHGRDKHLLKLLLDARAAGATQIKLTEDDLTILQSPAPPPLPDALGVAAAIAAGSHEAAAGGDFEVLLLKGSGPSGAMLLGRFCHTDQAIESVVRKHVAAEEEFDPEADYAEIVHLPEGRVGNIIARPVLRGHEIAFVGRSGAPEDRQLALTDLLVSVRDGRIVLRSALTGRRVIPRLTNAHYFQRGALAAYRFLASLQFDGTAASLAWHWGALASAPYLPRVVLGRTVLDRAQWAVSQRELAPVVKAVSPARAFRALQQLRAARGLPQWVVIVAQGDNELTVDLDTAAGCEQLAHEARKTGALRLIERFPSFSDLCVEVGDRTFFHELVLPLVRMPDQPVASLTPRIRRLPATPPGFEDTFLPGSPWLSAKLYTGLASTDVVLRGVVAPVVAEAVHGGACDGWFFIRYRDPDPHVRLRLHGHPDRVAGELLPLLHRASRPFADAGVIWRVQVDTYAREVDRYGGPAGILLAERLFQADSEAALALLLTSDGEDGAASLADRWRLALAGVDRLFADLDLDLPARQALARMWRDQLAAEFRGTGANARRLAGKLMRTERAGLEALLDGVPGSPVLATGLTVLDRRSDATRDALSELRALDASESLSQPLGFIALSVNHMSVIRLLRGAPRLQELVIYDLLDRLYHAQLSRKGNSR